MVRQLSWPLLAALLLVCSWVSNGSEQAGAVKASSTKSDITEKHYRQAAWQFYLQQPAAALEALQLAPSRDARTQLLEAGLYLQLDMPLHAATILQQVLEQPTDSQNALPQALRNIALLQFSRYQLETGNKIAAKQYLAQVNMTADKQYLGQQQLLSQLLHWPDISIPKTPDFNLLADQAEMPYIVSNQALIIAKQQPEVAQHWLAQLQTRLGHTVELSFWQQLFSGHWLTLNTPTGFSYPQAERAALVDYVQLSRAELYINSQDWAAADAILSQFPQNSVLSSNALALYRQILTEQRHIPTLLAVLQQQIKQQPYSVTAWQAATRIGEQLERNQQPEAALAAYRWADKYYQQQQYGLLREAKPIDVSQLAEPLTPWQQLQFSSDDQLHQLQQQSIMLQQHINQAPVRQARLARLQQVVDYKSAKQHSLLTSQLPAFHAQRQVLTQQVASLQQQIAEQAQQPSSLFLTQGELQQQLTTVQQAQGRLVQLQQHDSQKYQAHAQRLQRLSGLLLWQYQHDQADRLWQLSKQQQQLVLQLEQVSTKLHRLSQLGDGENRLQQQQQRLQNLSAQQQQLNMALLSNQQRKLAQLNQKLQQHRLLQSEQLQQLQRHNKQAMARMMEQLLTSASRLNEAKHAD
ncbi:tetratricopeptide repeat protein [Rheinheimera salexigens]|uniref:Tetratricopeptide repeat-like domain-containing protein n=1 Tax=Rheinheimera salexigens TaxID=1628148 RepID=A0A1E7Q8Y6_9GAMM|nr:hypothetical protein [Rheinheimera salexigens]OEY70498.1 hypothetical protein BI198_13685 [Rheinheimera salexigens]